MIDLTKYDGHTPGPWIERHACVTANAHRIELWYDPSSDNLLLPLGDYRSTLHLITDAPLLKSELARIYSGLTQLTSDLENGSYTESITTRLRNILEGK